MKTYQRTVTPEHAAELRATFAALPEWFFIPSLGQTAPRGKYTRKVIFYSRRGGNEWSPARKVEQFRIYY